MNYQQQLEIGEPGIFHALTTVTSDNVLVEPEYIGIKQAVKKGYIECEVGGVANFSYPTSKLKRGRVIGGGNVCSTIMSAKDNGQCRIEKNGDMRYRIRRLTSKECWRAMDLLDEDYEKASKVNSETQLHKEAGNGIVVNVLVAIFGRLFDGKENVYKRAG